MIRQKLERIINNKPTYKSFRVTTISLLLTIPFLTIFFDPSSPLVSFILGLLFLDIFVQYAPRLGFIDIPNTRSSHSRPTPRSAGIACVIAIGMASFFMDTSVFSNFTLTIGAVFLVFALGVIDDLKNLRARYKIVIILMASLLACWEGFIIPNLGIYFNQTVPLLFFATPLTLFAMLAFTNSFNLIDGLDGLAAMISIIIFSCLWFIGYQYNDQFIMGITSIFIPAMIAFLIFNWNPAKAFLGDSGSLTVGFVISLLAIKAVDHVSPIVILYLVAIPMIDTITIMLRRYKSGKPIFSPDRNHLHHIVVDIFSGNVKKAVLTIASIQGVYALFGVYFSNSKISDEFCLVFLLLNITSWYLVLTSKKIAHLRTKSKDIMKGSIKSKNSYS